MSRKQSQHAREGEPPGIDDLKLIHGIGPAVESRLHGVGIYTFAQLTTLSPADIAAPLTDLTGLTAERIIKQDWIGQARHLAGLLKQTEEEQTTTVQDLEIASQAPDEEQVEPVPPSFEASEPVATQRMFGGILHLNDLEMTQESSGSHRTILTSNQPFVATLTLDLHDVMASPEESLTYTASIYVMNLQKNTRLLLGQARGPVTTMERQKVTVQAYTREQGVYRLEVLVTMARTGGDLATHPGLIAGIESGLLLFI